MKENDTPGLLGVAMYALDDTRLYVHAEVGLVGPVKHDLSVQSLWFLAQALSSSGIPEEKWHEAVDDARSLLLQASTQSDIHPSGSLFILDYDEEQSAHEGHPQEPDGAAGEGFTD
jgi:hypothetical protein